MRRIALIVIFLLLLAPCWQVSADTSGPLPAGTGGNNAGVGTVDWANTGNISLSDNSRATVTLAGNETSHYLTATNFGFSIPTGATILGITAELELGADATFGNGENSIKIIKGGTVQGTEKSTDNTWGAIGGTDQTTTYGGTSDLWGLSWTVADINASNFGVAAACDTNGVGAAREGRVDRVQITITYNLPFIPRRLVHWGLLGKIEENQTRIAKSVR